MPRSTLRGHEGVRRLLATPPLEHLERQILVDDVVSAGERAVALARMLYSWRESGDCAGVHHGAAVLDIHNGLVTRWQPFPDREAALAAAEHPSASSNSAERADRAYGIPHARPRGRDR